jgi:hypothetical protein
VFRQHRANDYEMLWISSYSHDFHIDFLQRRSGTFTWALPALACVQTVLNEGEAFEFSGGGCLTTSKT